jgi:hypothetical protein
MLFYESFWIKKAVSTCARLSTFTPLQAFQCTYVQACNWKIYNTFVLSYCASKKKFASQITPQKKTAIQSYSTAYTTSKENADSIVKIDNWP